MPGGGRMRDVEFSDVSVPTDDPAHDVAPRSHRRRNLAVLLTAVLAVALALVGTQEVLGARERSRIADLDGVLGPLDAAPAVVWTSDEAARSLWSGPLGDDALATVNLTEDGTKQLVALDAATGERLWSTTLVEPSPARAAALTAGDGVSDSGGPCATAGAHLVCLVTDGFTRWSDDSSLEVPATSTTLQVIDRADGSVVSSRPVTGSSLLLRGPDRAVTAARTDAGVDVSEYSLSTGERVWVRPLGSPFQGSTFHDPIELLDLGDHIGVQSSEATALIDGDGEIARPDVAASTQTITELRGDGGGRVLLVRGVDADATTTVVDADGTGREDVVVHGAPVAVATNDGSVPGLLLTAGQGLSASDDSTGTLRWNAHDVHATDGGVVVLRGAVYVPTASELVALDGVTGAARWRVPLQSEWDQVRTDGRHLIVDHPPVDGADDAALLAYAPRDGHEVWHTAYPEGVDSVVTIGHRFYGRGSDGSLVALG